MKFSGASGHRPRTEARRYIYAVLASCLDNDLGEKQGWVFGGTDEEPWEEQDRALLRKEAEAVIAELHRKAGLR